MREGRLSITRLPAGTALVLLVAALTLTSCSPNRAPASHGESFPTILPASQSSRIQGVPVPAAARVEPHLSSPEQEIYRLPPEQNFGMLLSFYARSMPPGLDFGTLRWCDATPLYRPQGVERSWLLPATDRVLLVRLTGEGAGLIWIQEASDPGRVCNNRTTR